MATLRPQQVGPVYPWRRNIPCELLVDPQVFMPALLDAIDNAREYVLLEMYLTESGTTTTAVIDALAAAAERGVSIYIVFDSFGSRNLSNDDRERLKHRNIEVTFYHPIRLWALRYLFVRDHRKFLLVDGRLGFTGGMGFSDGIEVEDGQRHAWHDIAVRFEGRVCADWQALFASHWQDITSIELSLDDRAGSGGGACSARVVASQPARLNPIYGHLRQRAGLAASRLWIATAYFLPSWRLRRAIHKAASRGVDVRLLLPGPITDNAAVRYASQGFYTTLLNAGVRIYEYQPTFQHAKVALVDDWVSVGSSNFDRWSMARNLETNLEVIDGEFATEVGALFERDFADSQEITEASWTARPLLQRWRENLWGTIETWTSKQKR
jgi:phosphatidylserine/phosphatidylglycerophosphate/cardiolipin synthase-like enzyme